MLLLKGLSIGADNVTWTHTVLLPLEPESSASADSAISAGDLTVFIISQKYRNVNTYFYFFKKLLTHLIKWSKIICGGIAQLVRALASHARGRGFKSPCLYHNRNIKKICSAKPPILSGVLLSMRLNFRIQKQRYKITNFPLRKDMNSCKSK